MLRWRKVSTVVRREYLSRVRTKAFWISTALVPVLLLAFTVVPALLARRTGGTYRVDLLTSDTALAGMVKSHLAARAGEESGKAGAVRITVDVVAPGSDPAAERTALKKAVVAKKLDAVVVLPADILDSGKAEYLSTNVTAFRLMDRLEGAVKAAVVQTRLIRAGLPTDRIAALTAAPEFVPVRIGEDLAENRESAMQSFFLSYLLMFLIWFTTMIYGMYVMRGVLEEKSSRIVEVIVANLSPFELMVGKIVGVGAVGLTQYAIWVVLAMNIAVPGMLGSMMGVETAVSIPPMLLVFFVVFFVLGYVLYSTMYAAVGAAFNTEEEAQQMQSVAGWVMAVPFLLLFPVINNPNSTFSTIISLVPFFSPVLFFLRMSVEMPPLWQTALCLVLLVGTIVVVARIAATIYRVGILMYGKRPTLRELVRWVRTA